MSGREMLQTMESFRNLTLRNEALESEATRLKRQVERAVELLKAWMLPPDRRFYPNVAETEEFLKEVGE